MKLKTYQHGDLLLRAVKINTEKGKLIAKGKCVLAHGESGHSHVVEDSEAGLIQLGEKMLLSLGQTATLKHEEHAPITLEPGLYEIGQVNEYDYLSQMTRKVMD